MSSQAALHEAHHAIVGAYLGVDIIEVVADGEVGVTRHQGGGDVAVMVAAGLVAEGRCIERHSAAELEALIEDERLACEGELPSDILTLWDTYCAGTSTERRSQLLEIVDEARGCVELLQDRIEELAERIERNRTHRVSGSMAYRIATR